MAGLIGRDKTFITHMMKGKRTVAYADARILSEALGKDVFVLFDVADATDSVAIEAAA